MPSSAGVLGVIGVVGLEAELELDFEREVEMAPGSLVFCLP